MACYHPIKAHYRIDDFSGKKDICFDEPVGGFCQKDGKLYPFKIELPCGQCIGCRLEYSRQWAVRCVLEAMQYEHNYFITLTYSPEEIPKKYDNVNIDFDTGEFVGYFTSNPLVPEHVTKFMKDLRRYFEYHYDWHNIRFYAVGEYGEQSMRPHYHLILFNCPIPDLELLGVSNGQTFWKSDILQEQIWKKGIVSIGTCTFESCAYVARYMLKKQKGLNSDYYSNLGLSPPFSRCSRMPGIAREYYDKERDKIYSTDSLVITNGKGIAKKVKPPSYYDKLYDIDNPEDLKRIKECRTESAINSINNQLSRTSLDLDTYLAVKEDIKNDKVTRLVRCLC